MSEKTEKPTPRRLEKARKDGQVPRSRVLPVAVAFSVGTVLLVRSGRGAFRELESWSERVFSGGVLEPREALGQALGLAGGLLWPLLVACLVAALSSSVALVGFRFEPQLLGPKWERLDPFAGFRKLFSGKRLKEVGSGVLFLGLLVLLISLAGMELLPLALSSQGMEGSRSMDVVLALVGRVFERVAWVLAAAGVAAWLHSRWQHHKELRMSRSDVRQEHKNEEGDPQVKARRKALHRQAAQGGAARGVASAQVVVVNPTRLAVALRYDSGECGAPYIVAKGRGLEAARIRGEAGRTGVPLVRDIPLARSLIQLDVGEAIPEELYQAAAAVLAVALDQKSSREKTEGASK